MDLAHIDKMLKLLDQRRVTAEQGQFFMDLIRDDQTKDFAWIETRLRYLDCRLLFLLALPINTAPPQMTVFDPWGRYEPRFWIWHSVNGPEERLLTMRHYRISTDDAINVENLKLAGFLGVKEWDYRFARWRIAATNMRV